MARTLPSTIRRRLGAAVVTTITLGVGASALAPTASADDAPGPAPLLLCTTGVVAQGDVDTSSQVVARDLTAHDVREGWASCAVH